MDRVEAEQEWESLSHRKLDMTQLLQWSTAIQQLGRDDDPALRQQQQSGQEINRYPTPRPQLDTKWVEILMGKSSFVQMKEYLDTVIDSSKSMNARVDACANLQEMAESVDNAKNFVKAGLHLKLLDCLSESNQEFLAYVVWTFGCLCSNEFSIKKKFLIDNILPRLTALVHSYQLLQLQFVGELKDEELPVVKKYLFFVSSMLSNNAEGQELFTLSGGNQLLLNLVQNCLSICNADNAKSKVLKPPVVKVIHIWTLMTHSDACLKWIDEHLNAGLLKSIGDFSVDNDNTIAEQLQTLCDNMARFNAQK
ncbi:hypothetical protein MP228_009548 [Amoeboaphelidium protococcarum]|nr:hypothetical protein MP228_009548 [Amoeboaphelidium protococcarum]